MTNISDPKFRKAYEIASTTDLKFPPDIMLLFYAYYKRATSKDSFYVPEENEDLRDSFKANALLQVQKLTPEEARIKYIQMVEEHIAKI